MHADAAIPAHHQAALAPGAAWTPLVALTRRELVRFARQPSRVIASVGTPLLMWAFLAGGFGSGVAGREASYALHLLPGMASLVVVFSAVFAAISLIDDRNAGFLQGVLCSPVPRWAIAWSKLAGSSILAVAQAAVLLPGAPILGASPGPDGYALALGALALTSVGVGGIALALAWRVNSVPGFHGVMNLVLMPLWLLSGAFFPVESSAGWLRPLVLANPLSWANLAVRDALAGSPANATAWIATGAFGAAGAGLAWVALGRGR